MTPTQFDRLPLLSRDPGDVGASLGLLAKQLHDGWIQARLFNLPRRYQKITAIAVCGMGGSHLGPDILRSVLGEQVRVPVTIVADYHLPHWVNRSTLVIGSSYSGGTEETLAAVTEARQRGAPTIVITGGGALGSYGRRHHVPAIVYRPSFNPSNQPRLGIAYSLMACLAAWKAAGIVTVPIKDIVAMATSAERSSHSYGLARSAKTNPAKRVAMALAGKIPLLIGAEWTAGNLHTFANQIHENAKTYAAWYQLPDLNHHLLEGLRNRAVTKQMHAVMIRDAAYHPRNLRRFVLTKKILEDLGTTVSVVTPNGKTRLEKSTDLLSFGGYVSWYLAALRRVNPAPIPTVDALKKALGR